VVAAAVVALTTFAAVALSLQTRRQLGTMGAFQATWFDLGLNVAATGVFGSGTAATVYKPPGYPLFVAASVRALHGRPVLCDTCDTGPHWGRLAYRRRVLEACARALGWAQALAHAGAAAALCLLLAGLVRLPAAVLGALLFGLDPLLIVLAGATHYTTLHLLFINVGCVFLVACLAEPPVGRRGVAWWVGAGLWWGVATLVRPVTLLLPPFVLAAALAAAKGRARQALAGVGWFALGMAVAIGPWIVRNHGIAHRWLPVNAQFWSAVFASTAVATKATPDRMRWRDALPAAREVATRSVGRPVTGVYEPLLVRENLLLESGYREAALGNLRRQPRVYVENALRSLWSYHVHTTGVYLAIFRYYQQPGGTWPRWGTTNTAADPATWPGGAMYRLLGALLTALAFAGTGLALYRREARLLGVAAVHSCLAIAHALSWMDFTYLYLRIPFDVVLATYLIEAGLVCSPRRPVRLAAVATAAAVCALLGLSLLEVFVP
jgi:hypothetical protein